MSSGLHIAFFLIIDLVFNYVNLFIFVTYQYIALYVMYVVLINESKILFITCWYFTNYLNFVYICYLWLFFFHSIVIVENKYIFKNLIEYYVTYSKIITRYVQWSHTGYLERSLFITYTSDTFPFGKNDAYYSNQIKINLHVEFDWIKVIFDNMHCNS